MAERKWNFGTLRCFVCAKVEYQTGDMQFLYLDTSECTCGVHLKTACESCAQKLGQQGIKEVGMSVTIEPLHMKPIEELPEETRNRLTAALRLIVARETQMSNKTPKSQFVN